MSNKDKEAFDKWFLETYRYDYKDLVIPESIKPQKEAWQAAIEYMRKEYSNIMDAMTKTSQNNFKLQAENAKLRKCVEFYSNTDNWLEEKNRNNLYTIIKEDASDDYCDYLRFGGKRARQVLKELGEK